jgi:hypothetical protein
MYVLGENEVRERKEKREREKRGKRERVAQTIAQRIGRGLETFRRNLVPLWRDSFRSALLQTPLPYTSVMIWRFNKRKGEA